MGRPGQYPGGAQAAPAAERAGSPAWRRLRQRIKALWRWVIVRQVRAWLGGRSRPEDATEMAQVKQFPQQSRWH